jgi:hypothetical protein
MCHLFSAEETNEEKLCHLSIIANHLSGDMNDHPDNLASSNASTQRDTAALPSASALSATTLPRSVLLVALVIIAFIGLLTLETSDSFFRHDHQIARSLFVLPVPALLLHGFLTRRRWAWRATRIIALLTAILYALPSIGVWLFFPQMQTGPRIWITTVSAILFALALSAYLTLGRRPARAYFQV